MFNNMLRMDAGGINTGKKVIINVDHITGVEEKPIGCIIHLVDGAAIEVNETIDDIWKFMYSQQDKPTYTSYKTFDPDKKVERKHVM